MGIVEVVLMRLFEELELRVALDVRRHALVDAAREGDHHGSTGQQRRGLLDCVSGDVRAVVGDEGGGGGLHGEPPVVVVAQYARVTVGPEPTTPRG